MAWLDCERTGIYQIGFSFGGTRFKRSLKTRDEPTARAAIHRVEENLRLVASGRLTIPPTADIPTFLLSDGRLSESPQIDTRILLLGDLFDTYQSQLPANALGAETSRVMAIHMRHVARILGNRRQLQTVTREDLQRYVNIRAEEKGKRNRPVSTGTITKELATFRTLWRWAKDSNYVNSEFPRQGLRFSRLQEKMPFLTWAQVTQRLERGIPSGLTAADYWDCLYLGTSELDELLAVVRSCAEYEFLYPMCLMAAHTGARRSELCRSLREDIDLENGCMLIREKKKRKGKETFRHVPMSPRLQSELADWLGCCALSPYTFPLEHRVRRARNQRRRENPESVSPDEASDHLKHALVNTKWEVIRGWHIFRHSFISNCATEAVDQRMIDAWVGHQTEEMRRRYRHLFPHRQKQELTRVFG